MNKANTNKSLLGYAVIIIAIVITVALLAAGWRLAAADYTYGKALQEAIANRGVPTFNLLNQAIRLNKYNAGYQLTSSQVNLGIASNLAQRSNKLTDQDRVTIQQLVRRAIQDAKNAVALNRTRADFWVNLANIYRNLINIAQGADQWAIASYQQAIVLNPNNPRLRIAYGQLLYSLNRLEAAQRQFEAATALKPDLANAHYNLAVVAKQQEKFELAKTEFMRTLSALQPDSADVSKVQKELDAVNAQLKKKITATTVDKNKVEEKKPVEGKRELEGPKEATAGAAALQPPLKLSEEESAPAITPVPSPQTTPTPTLEF